MSPAINEKDFFVRVNFFGHSGGAVLATENKLTFFILIVLATLTLNHLVPFVRLLANRNRVNSKILLNL